MKRDTTRTERIVAALAGLRDLIRAVEGVLIDLVAAAAPWLAPVIPAYLAWHNMVDVLAFPVWIAWIGAAVVELAGLSAVHTTFTLWDYNDTKRKSDQQAPVQVSLAITVFYLAIILIVNVALDTGTALEKLAITLLSLLTVVGSVILAVRASHARRLLEIERERAERKQERAERKAEIERQEQETAEPEAEVLPEQVETVPERAEPEALPAAWPELTPEHKRQLSGMDAAAIAAAYPVSERTARNWRKRLQKNGNGAH